MKTIFYTPSNNKQGYLFFGDKPYDEFITLNNSLYKPNKNDYNHFTCLAIEDWFSDNGIIRRIAIELKNN